MDRRPFPLVGAIGVAVPVSLSVAVVSLRITVQLGLGQGVSCAVATTAVIISLLALHRPTRWRTFSLPTTAEVGATVVCALTALMLWVCATDRSLTWPHAFGVDQAHNGALVAAIHDSGSLSTNDPRLGPMSGYPPGAHLLSVAASRLLQVNPLSAMWIVAMLTVATQFFSVVWLAATVTRRSWVAGLGAGALWLLGWRMSVNMVTVAFWFAQSVSVTLSLGGVAAACLAVQHRVRPRWLVAAAVCSLASQLTYPQSTPIVPLAVMGALSVRLPPLRRAMSIVTGRRRNRLIAVACVAAVGVQVLFIKRLPYFTLTAFSGNGEGIVTPINVAAFGGPIAVAVIAWGIVEILALSWRRHPAARAIVGAACGPLGFALVLLAIEWSGTPVTRYRLLKNWFSAFPYLAVAGGVAVGAARDALGSLRGSSTSWPLIGRWLATYGGAVAIASVYIGLFASGPRMRSTDLPLISRDMYVLGRSASTRYPVEQIGVAGDALGPYTAWWTALRRLPPGTLTNELIPRASRFDAWPLGSTTERYLLVDETVASEYERRPGVRIVARRGGARLLERTGTN